LITPCAAPATASALAPLESLGMVEKLTARRRGRVFAYREYVALINAELGDGQPA
jgi:hypothetical protein